MSAPICTWPSCKCTARDQCKGLGVRAALDPAPDHSEWNVDDALTFRKADKTHQKETGE